MQNFYLQIITFYCESMSFFRNYPIFTYTPPFSTNIFIFLHFCNKHRSKKSIGRATFQKSLKGFLLVNLIYFNSIFNGKF